MSDNINGGSCFATAVPNGGNILSVFADYYMSQNDFNTVYANSINLNSPTSINLGIQITTTMPLGWDGTWD